MARLTSRPYIPVSALTDASDMLAARGREMPQHLKALSHGHGTDSQILSMREIRAALVRACPELATARPDDTSAAERSLAILRFAIGLAEMDPDSHLSTGRTLTDLIAEASAGVKS